MVPPPKPAYVSKKWLIFSWTWWLEKRLFLDFSRLFSSCFWHWEINFFILISRFAQLMQNLEIGNSREKGQKIISQSGAWESKWMRVNFFLKVRQYWADQLLRKRHKLLSKNGGPSLELATSPEELEFVNFFWRWMYPRTHYFFTKKKRDEKC